MATSDGRERRRRYVLSLCMVLMALLGFVPAATAKPFSLDLSPLGSAQALDDAEVLRDPSGTWSIADVNARADQFRPAASLMPDIWASVLAPSTLWFRLQPRSASSGPWFLTTTANVDRAELIFAAPDGGVHSVSFGMMVPFNQRSVRLTIPMAMLPDGATAGGTLYLRTVTRPDHFGGFSIHPATWLATKGRAAADASLMPELLVIGLIAGLGLFSASLGIALREAVYLHYAGAMACFCLYLAADCRAGWQWLWPGLSLCYDTTVGALYVAYLALIIGFARRFLDRDGSHQGWWRLIWSGWGVLAVFEAIIALDPNLLERWRLGPALDATLSGSLLCMILASGLLPLRRGHTGAPAFMIAFAGVVTGLLVEDCGNDGIITWSAWTEAASGIGVAWEALFLSVAVAQRMLMLRSERDQMASLADHDGLTGIPNRRSFDRRFTDEWRRATRSGSALTLIMLDVDCFKAYNDAYGHPAGDSVLIRVAAAIGASLGRAEDLLCRYGGEEFAIVLPNTSIEHGTRVAEKIRAAVNAMCLPHVASLQGHITLSAGVAATIPDARTCPETLLHAADAALYDAKRAGRNRVFPHVPVGLTDANSAAPVMDRPRLTG